MSLLYAMTNVFSSVFQTKSYIQTKPRSCKGFHSTPSKLFILRRRFTHLQLWYNLHSYVIYHRERKKQGLIFHSSIRFWRFMPKGEKVLAQSKRTAPPPIFKKIELRKDSSIGDFSIGILLEFQIGSTSSKLISKTLLNTKRRI